MVPNCFLWGFFVGWNKCYACFAVLPWTSLVQHQDKWWHLFTHQAKLPHPTLLPKILWKVMSVAPVCSSFYTPFETRALQQHIVPTPTLAGVCRSKVRCHVHIPVNSRNTGLHGHHISHYDIWFVLFFSPIVNTHHRFHRFNLYWHLCTL